MTEGGRNITKEDKIFIADTIEKVFDPEDTLFSDYKECIIAFGNSKSLDIGNIDYKKLQHYVESRLKVEQKEL